MKYTIKEDPRTKIFKVRLNGIEEGDWGRTEITVSSLHSSKNYAKYCPGCDTWYLPYKTEVRDTVEQIQRDGKAILIEERKDCSQAQYVTATKDRAHKRFFCDRSISFIVSVDYHVEDYKKYEVDKEVRCDFTTVDTYAFSDEYLKIRNSFDRIEIIDEREERCEICGTELIDGISACSLLLENREERLRNEIANIVETKTRECYSKKYQGDDGIDLTEFIKKLIDVETCLKYLIERKVILEISLEDLPKMRRKADGRKNYERVSEIRKKKRQLESLSPEYLSEQVIDCEIEIKRPDEPIYEKPSLFTKKRVEENNERLRQEYNAQLKEFEEKRDKHIKDEIERRKCLNKKKKEEFEQKKQVLDAEIQELENIPVGGESDPFGELYQMLQEEICDIDEKIEQACKIRGEMMGMEIIHPKYVNLVALTTISEYLETGRCNVLSGPDGAYNLFEQEIRDNIVIARLDNVLESLEEIKQNQYSAYLLLDAIETDLSQMDTKFDKALKSISVIEKNTDDIRKNAEITAYYSEKTAQYAKIQTELTNAMGYLIAFK